MLIDSHFHLANVGDGLTLADVLKEGYQNDVRKFILIGTHFSDNAAVIKASKENKDVYSVIGCYPHEELNKSFSEIYQKLHEQYLFGKSKIVGIGECGIDITDWSGGRSIEDQLELFKLQLGFAAEVGLPVVIHNRNGDNYVYEIINKYRRDGVIINGVLHCFASTWEFAKKMLDLGFYISFSSLITYPSRKELLETVRNVPEDKYIIETDSPYLPPQGHRGETNYPKYVKMVAEKVAEIRNTSFEKVAQQTYENTCKLFSIM